MRGDNPKTKTGPVCDMHAEIERSLGRIEGFQQAYWHRKGIDPEALVHVEPNPGVTVNKKVIAAANRRESIKQFLKYAAFFTGMLIIALLDKAGVM